MSNPVLEKRQRPATTKIRATGSKEVVKYARRATRSTVIIDRFARRIRRTYSHLKTSFHGPWIEPEQSIIPDDLPNIENVHVLLIQKLREIDLRLTDKGLEGSAIHQEIEGLIREVERADLDPVFLNRADRLATEGRLDASLDLIYSTFDAALRRGAIEQIDRLIAGLSPEAYGADTLIAVLTATLPCRSRLSSREEFFRKAKLAISHKGEFEEGLLDGLD